MAGIPVSLLLFFFQLYYNNLEDYLVHEREREREVTQLCLTLSDPMDCSPPGSSTHGIFQAKVPEWVAMPFSRDLPDPGSNSGLLHCRQILYHLGLQYSF